MNNKTDKSNLNGKNGGIAFAMLMAFYVLISFIIQPIATAIIKNQAICFAVCSLCSTIALVVMLAFLRKKLNLGFRLMTKTQTVGGLYSAVAILLSLGMFLGLGFSNTVVATLVESIGLNSGGINVPLGKFWHLLIFSFTLAVFPAIFEELFFRGVLLNCFSQIKTIPSILLSALCFALFHGSATQFIYQFIYGVCLGFLAHNSKSVVPCMVAHFLNNFTVLLLTYLNVVVDLFSPVVLLIGINLLAFFGTATFFKYKKSDKNQVQKGEIKNFLLPFGIFAIILCLTLIVGNLFVV